MLARMFDKRLAGYRAMGYEVVGDGERTDSFGDRYVIEYGPDAMQAPEADWL